MRAYRSSEPYDAGSPKRRCSDGSPPLTMFSSSRPSEIRWYVEAIWAASVGWMEPGRKATRNFSRSVSRMSAAVVNHASSHHVPVGVSVPENPSSSAVRATCDR